MTQVCKIEHCAREVKARGLCNRHYLRLMRNGNPLKKKKKWNEPISFKVDENGCFICDSHKPGAHGYPQVRHKGRSSPAHRRIYEECFGDIKKGLVVRHRCDNKLCINPEHLLIGTRADNVRDAVERKRNAFGERSGGAKLSSGQVAEIKTIFSYTEVNKQLVRSLSKRYGVAISTIYDIYYERTWKHIEVS